MWGGKRVRRETFSKRGGEAKGGKEFNECIQNTISTCLIPIRLIHPIRVFKTVIRYNKGSQRLSTRKSSEILPFPPCHRAFRRILFFLWKKNGLRSLCLWNSIRKRSNHVSNRIELLLGFHAFSKFISKSISLFFSLRN